MALVPHYGSGNIYIGWYLVRCAAVFPKPEVATLGFIMAYADNFWNLNVILVREILILGGIWSFSAVFQNPEVAILEFKMVSILAPVCHS